MITANWWNQSQASIIRWFCIWISDIHRSQSSMYHSIGNCVFLFLEAVLTFEHEHIVKASEAISQCLAVCNRHRKKNTITESMARTFKRVRRKTVYLSSAISESLQMFFSFDFFQIRKWNYFFVSAQLWAIHWNRSSCWTLFGWSASSESIINIHWRWNSDESN